MFGSCELELPTTVDGDSPRIPASPMVLIQETIVNEPVVIVASKDKNLIVSFKRTLNGEVLNFYPTPFQAPVAFVDENGTLWDIFGVALTGLNKGQQLEQTSSMIGYWFSFASFFPGLTIYPSSDQGDNYGQNIIGTNGWSIPAGEVRDGGPGIDGIPALTNPRFIEAKDDNFLDPDDLIVGFFDGEEYKAYPHKILDWHEIVNESNGPFDYSIIYCPLTGTATAWSGNLKNGNTTFGVSGLLYNSNIIPYDRSTMSYWSQILGTSVNGENRGTEAQTYPVIETTWSNWKKMYPDSKVLSDNTEYNRPYEDYPYGTYRTAEFLIFPVKYSDRRLPNKERVHAINVGNTSRVYKMGLEKHK